MSQMNPSEFVHNTAYIAGLSLNEYNDLKFFFTI